MQISAIGTWDIAAGVGLGICKCADTTMIQRYIIPTYLDDILIIYIL